MNTGQTASAGRFMIVAHWWRDAPASILLGVAAVACLVGALVPVYIAAMGEDSGAKLFALPAVLLLMLLFFYSRTAMLLIILVLRASTETLFESTRISFGGAALGIGGLINGFAILIAAVLIFEQPRRVPPVMIKAWLPFVGAIFYGVLLAPDRGDGVRLILQLMSEAAVFVGAAYLIQSPGGLRTALKLIVWSSVVPLIVGGYQLATGGGNEYAGEGIRLRATFSHPNPLAFYLTLVIAIIFYLLKGRLFALSQGRKILLACYLGLLFALLLLTKTRSAWVACACMFLGYALLFERRYLIYLVLAGGAALFVPGVGDRLLDLTQGSIHEISSYDRLNSFAWRQSIWISALDWMPKKTYLLGNGLEAFKFYSPIFFKEANNIHWGAHNVYVQLFFDLGAVGVATFVWLFGRLFLQMKRLVRIDRLGAFTMMFVIIEFLVVSASDNMLDYLSFNWYLWFILGVGVAWSASAEVDSKTSGVPAN